VRYRSVDNVMAEIACHLERHPRCNYILFLDDTFTLDPKRVDEFCRRLTALRKERDLRWFCEGHVQTLHKWPHMIARMAEAGLTKLALGIESGSDRVLSLYRKKTNADMMVKVSEQCCAEGIALLSGNIIIGGPEESGQTLAANLELVDRLLYAAPGKFDLYSFFLMPYPATAITGRPAEFGLSLCPRSQTQAMADMPLSQSKAVSWEGLFAARNQLDRRILQTMRDIHDQGLVPRDDIVRGFRLARKYGIYSRWLGGVFAADRIQGAYYQGLAANALSASQEIEPPALLHWRPQRMFPFWDTVVFEKGETMIGGHALSPLEKELLLLSSGKLTLSQVLRSAQINMGKTAWDEKLFASAAMQVLRRFEQRCWLAYARF
jgi:hypothetical protein